MLQGATPKGDAWQRKSAVLFEIPTSGWGHPGDLVRGPRTTWELPKIRVPYFGVLIIRVLVS